MLKYLTSENHESQIYISNYVANFYNFGCYGQVNTFYHKPVNNITSNLFMLSYYYGLYFGMVFTYC